MCILVFPRACVGVSLECNRGVELLGRGSFYVYSITCCVFPGLSAATEHRRLAFTEGCFSVVGALILSLALPEAPVVSGHVTEMAGDPGTGVFGLGRDRALPP